MIQFRTELWVWVVTLSLNTEHSHLIITHSAIILLPNYSLISFFGALHEYVLVRHIIWKISQIFCKTFDIVKLLETFCMYYFCYFRMCHLNVVFWNNCELLWNNDALFQLNFNENTKSDRADASYWKINHGDIYSIVMMSGQTQPRINAGVSHSQEFSSKAFTHH